MIRARPALFRRSIIILVGAVFLATVLFLTLVDRDRENTAELVARQVLQQQLSQIVAGLQALPPAERRPWIDAILRRPLGRGLTVFDAEGARLAEVREALAANGPSSVHLRVESGGRRMLAQAEAVEGAEGPLVVRAEVPLSEGAWSDAGWSPWWKGLLIGGVVSLVGICAMRWAHRPLMQALSHVEDLPVERDRDEANLVDGIVATARRALAQAGNASDDDVLRAILGAMSEGLVAVDHEGRVLFCNPSAQRQLDMADEDHGERPLWRLTPDQEVVEVLDEVVESGIDHERDLARRIATGDRFMRLRATPLRIDGRRGAVAILTDVTDLRRLEIIRRDFVTNVSHELKTPLTVVRGVIETLLEDPDMPASVRRSFLGKADHQTDRLSALIADLMTLAQYEAEGGDASVVDLLQPAREAVEAQRPFAENRRIELHFDAGSARVVGDHEALRQVADNLISNAVRYSPEDSAVHVGVECDDQSARLTVSDQGVGIPRHSLDRIFERFYRVDKARSRAVGGTGLGLSIVRHIVNSHNGSVSVQSEPGVGSTFIVQLPLAARTVSNHIPSSQESPS